MPVFMIQFMSGLIVGLDSKQFLYDRNRRPVVKQILPLSKLQVALLKMIELNSLYRQNK